MHVEKKSLARIKKIVSAVRPGRVVVVDGYADALGEHRVRVRLGEPGHAPFVLPLGALRTLSGDVEIEPLPDGRLRVGNAVVASDLEVMTAPTNPDIRTYPLDLTATLVHLRRCEQARAKGPVARALLTAVAVTDDGEFLSTDGRCGYWSTDGSAKPLREAAGREAVLPGVAYKVLRALGWTTAEVGWAGGAWYFRGANGEEAWLRGLEGRYFPVRELAPGKYTTTLRGVDKAELLQALTEALKTVAKDPPHAVTLTIYYDILRVSAKNRQGSEFRADVPAERLIGPALTLNVNAKLLLAGLSEVTEGLKAVTMEFSGAETLFQVEVRGAAPWHGGVWIQMPMTATE